MTEEWWNLNARDRNHLLAALIVNGNDDSHVSQAEVCSEVGELVGTENQPSKQTTSRALRSLEEHGLVERTEIGGGGGHGHTRDVSVTDDGRELLRDVQITLETALERADDE